MGIYIYLHLTQQSLSSAQSAGGEGEGCLDCCSQYIIENITGTDTGGWGQAGRCGPSPRVWRDECTSGSVASRGLQLRSPTWAQLQSSTADRGLQAAKYLH